MAFDLLHEALVVGPALPEPFVRFELESELTKEGLLPRPTGDEGRRLQNQWEAYRRKLRDLVSRGGPERVRHHVLEPLAELLEFAAIEPSPAIATREGTEPGGHILRPAGVGPHLRVWSSAIDEDLDAPARRGSAYRFSHLRIAQRVLLAANERLGLLTNGVELRVLISDPARPDSQVIIPIDPLWKRQREVPDSFRFLKAVGNPKGIAALPGIVEKARLQQVRVTKELRVQARQAIEDFVQAVLDRPENRQKIEAFGHSADLARALWREGLILVYRLLFILKLESADDPARAFGFSSTSLWRNSFSPTVALARHARAVLDKGASTGKLLEDGLRALFRMFAQGLACSELKINPLGGALFGEDATPLLTSLQWGELAVARLLDRLLWTAPRRGTTERERVHYGPLDVEDLGRVYEALLELEPGLATERMCRLRRQKLEVVVPVEQGEPYRRTEASPALETEEEDQEPEEETEEETTGRRTKVEWIEEILPGRFFLRVGLGRKATGSYYTPHSFVRFLVQETLGPKVEECCPKDDPRPAEILKLRVLDPAMGSGHFLVEACRFLGEKLYEACRLCDEKAGALERQAENAKPGPEQQAALGEAAAYRTRVQDLPDPDDELVRYLPSRAPEGPESGLSQRRALALCKRLVAVHCLYGVDLNPLAVELAKLTLWLEAHAEGLPLTFLDHRLVFGNSITGPFFKNLLTYPGSQEPLDDLFTRGLAEALSSALNEALRFVLDLEASVGIDLAEVELKRSAKQRLDEALAPFRVIAAAWAGGVMLGREEGDDPGYAELVRRVAETKTLPPDLSDHPRLLAMIARGLGLPSVPGDGRQLLAFLFSEKTIPALPFDLAFPEVFFPRGLSGTPSGFDAVLGNPPWDRFLPADKEFFASFDFRILGAATKRERAEIQKRLLSDVSIKEAHETYLGIFREGERSIDRLYSHQIVMVSGEKTIGKQDLFRIFMERNPQLLGPEGATGVVVPSAFHANEGATGVRRLYLQDLALRCCFSFENRRKLFEIDSRMKFAAVVASLPGPTRDFDCAFYLHDDEWLFGDRSSRESLRYSLDFVSRTGGEYMSFLELRSAKDREVAEICYANGEPFGTVCSRLGIKLGRELNMTDDAWRFTPTAQVLPGGEDPRDPEVAARLLNENYLVIPEGKNFHQFTDHWETRPRYLISLGKCFDRPDCLANTVHFRLVFRDIASSTNERTCIFFFSPPGTIFGNKTPCERTPEKRKNCDALFVASLVNSFSFDFMLRQKVASTVNLFILESTSFPLMKIQLVLTRSFFSHSCLRLVGNHSGFLPLWREQLGEEWREAKPKGTWPVLATDEERWEVRSAIDAVVAQAYGLNRDQYAHVLSSFPHTSFPQAPMLCLAKFDELTTIGLEAFCRKYDPYWDVPLNENLPEPAIELPQVAEESREPPPQAALDFGDGHDAPIRRVAEEAKKKRSPRRRN